jgi:hypothetical protein
VKKQSVGRSRVVENAGFLKKKYAEKRGPG